MIGKFIAGVIVGAAAGTALAYFLQTEKGKEWVDNAKETAGKAGENLKSKLDNLDEEFANLLKKGKKFVEDLENKAKTAADNL